MAIVEPYNAQVLPQGEIQAHRQMARPEDFGATVGTGMEQLGQAGDRAANTLNQVETADDVTNMHVQFANARQQLTQQIQQMQNSATPGDPNFANNVISHVQQTLGSIGDSAQTREGQEVARQLTASLTSDFGQQAVSFQGELAAKGAENQYTQLSQVLGQTVYTDPSQYQSALTQGQTAIDDPKSIYARVPQSVRDSLKQKLQNDLTYARYSKQAELDPQGVLSQIDPQSLAALQPYAKAVAGNAAPGAKPSIGQPTMQYAPTALHAAAANGVNGNVILAQIDVESGGNPHAASKEGARGISQFMPETAKQYGVDVNDPVSSINGQSRMMGDLLRAFGGDYTKALAAYNDGSGNVAKLMHLCGNDWQKHLPAETQNYITTVMQKAGMVAPPQTIAEANIPASTDLASPDTTPGKPIPGLTWQQTDQVAQTSVRLSLLRTAIQTRTQEEELRQKKEAGDNAMSGYVQKIVDPGQYGQFDMKAALADPNLDWQQKEHLSQFSTSYVRGVEGQTHPAEVHDLMAEIHAPDTDPSKTYSMAPIDAAFRAGKLNTSEYRLLRKEVSDLQTGDGTPFQQKVHMAREAVYNSFTRSTIGQAMPNVAASAWYTFTYDLDNKIAQYRKENKDPSELLDPASRDYMLRPNVVQSYLTNAQGQMSGGARKVVAAGASSLPTYADYGSLKPGASYTDPQGNVRVKK